MSGEPKQNASNPTSRRRFLKVAGGVGLAGTAALGTWGACEIFAPKQPKKQTGNTHRSICNLCGTGCGIHVDMHEGNVVGVRGDEQAHNRGLICVKGEMLRSLPDLSGRLERPKIRKDGVLADASWDEALSLVAERFQEVIVDDGTDAVAYYGSGHLTTEVSYTAAKLFRAGVGTNNVDGNARLGVNSSAVAYAQSFGLDEPPGCFEDVDHADCFFIVGANPAACHPTLFERVLTRRDSKQGAEIVCVDPRASETAMVSDRHLSITPGTDLLLLNSMAQVICAESLYDSEFVERHVAFNDGTQPVTFDAFQTFLESYRPEAVETQIGIAAERIRETARRFARSQATISLWSAGVNQQADAVSVANMLSALHLITGHICRPGAGPLSLTGQANAAGGLRDAGALAERLPCGRQVENAEHRREMEQLWQVPDGTLSPTRGFGGMELFEAMGDGRVKAALIMGANPARSLPNSARHRKGLEKPFLVVVDVVNQTETAEFADVLLPAALWIEKQGVFEQSDRRYQLLDKRIDPPGEARDELDILFDLAERLGHGALFSARSASDVWNELASVSKNTRYDFSGITHERLRDCQGLRWPCPTPDHPGTSRRYVAGDDPFVRDSNRAENGGIDFYGQADGKAIVFLRAPNEPIETTSEDFPLQLTTGRVLEQWQTGTLTNHIPELKQASRDGHFELHEQDATPLGIKSGDRVEVTSRRGNLVGPVRVSTAGKPGVVFAPFYDAALPVNTLTADHLNNSSGVPALKLAAISVKKVTT